MRRFIRTFVALFMAAVITGPSVAEDFHFYHEHVLGTSLHLAVSCEDKSQASAIERRVLEEIDRLDEIFSRWNDQSELMAWQASDKIVVSDELARVLRRAEFWRTATSGGFDVRAEAIGRLWNAGADRRQTPSDVQLQELTTQLRHPPYQFSPDATIRRNDALEISLDGLAKGFILDQVCELVRSEHPGVSDFLINIGGDLRKLGDQPLEIVLENPEDAAEGSPPLQTFVVTQPISMATSGNYRRGSHILDPRTCLPAEQTRLVTVVGSRAIDVDALATSVSVLGPKQGIELIETVENTECCVVTASGSFITSSGWPLGSLPSTSRQFVLKDNSPQKEHGLFVDFTIQRPQGGRYRRPYVAMWLEDADGFPVKTEILWLQTEQPGPRWHRDLTRWYRNDRLRKTIENSDLIETISGATRGPGEYQAHFDGTDNLGKPLPPGEYILCLEVAREHGTYQIIREKVTWGNNPIDKKALKGNVEVGAMSYRFIPRREIEKDAS